ncbi:hypothetical protein [Streptomyces sp. NBC_00102]|uniref:hypothetical protein n=1 Tax=Streptomyces sp. NBC_00102 TaxID=2975652 RepID=UPI00224DDA79|nr:hypothetical protein [Streptomyces sp. NBC_00102]MCX5400650.1 hypothetical protein [Streptomyces sp. NBC_00102]
MEPVHVRCPRCLSDHAFVIPVYSCPCGAPTALRAVRGEPATAVVQRVWADFWVTARCEACGRDDHWPQPELGCPCGTVLRVPVRTESLTGVGTEPEVGPPATESATDPAAVATTGAAPDAGPKTGAGARTDPATATDPATSTAPEAAESPARIPLPRTAPRPRPPFQTLPIHTARDAVTAAGRYLGWLGFHGVVQPIERPASRVDLRADGALAQVETSTCPTGVREIECLWLNALSESASGIFFSLAGYEEAAIRRADLVSMPLFAMDSTGTPQPANGAAEDLLSSGA